MPHCAACLCPPYFLFLVKKIKKIKKNILFPLQSVCSPAAEVNSVKRIKAGGAAGLIAHTDLFVL